MPKSLPTVWNHVCATCCNCWEYVRHSVNFFLDFMTYFNHWFYCLFCLDCFCFLWCFVLFYYYYYFAFLSFPFLYDPVSLFFPFSICVPLTANIYTNHNVKSFYLLSLPQDWSLLMPLSRHMVILKLALRIYTQSYLNMSFWPLLKVEHHTRMSLSSSVNSQFQPMIAPAHFSNSAMVVDKKHLSSSPRIYSSTILLYCQRNMLLTAFRLSVKHKLATRTANLPINSFQTYTLQIFGLTVIRYIARINMHEIPCFSRTREEDWNSERVWLVGLKPLFKIISIIYRWPSVPWGRYQY